MLFAFTVTDALIVIRKCKLHVCTNIVLCICICIIHIITQTHYLLHARGTKSDYMFQERRQLCAGGGWRPGEDLVCLAVAMGSPPRQGGGE